MEGQVKDIEKKLCDLFQKKFVQKVGLIATICESFTWAAYLIRKWHQRNQPHPWPICPQTKLAAKYSKW